MRENKKFFISVTIALVITLCSSCVMDSKTEVSNKPDELKGKNTSDQDTKRNLMGNDMIINLNETNYDLNRKFEESSLKKLGLKELGILRNSIYAKYGYRFTSKEFVEYFSHVGWYKPEFDDVSNLLNKMDKQNIAAIKHYEDLLVGTQTVIKYSKDDKDCSVEGRGKIKLKDNKEETLFVTKEDIKTSEISNFPVRIKLKINSAEAVFESLWNDGVHVSIADFDKADNDVDIYITTAGTDIGANTYIYKYDGKKINQYDSFNHLTGRFCYDENGKIYFWFYENGKDDKREFNHFYDYKTKQSGRITDLSLKRKLNEQSLY